MELAPLLDELPPDRRLALAYAKPRVRNDALAIFLLDLRLSRLIAQRREPLLTQMRLAWWRDRLNEAPREFHHDEPVLALLADWGDRRRDLIALIDGWESLLAEPSIGDAVIDTFALGRAQAFAALARRQGCTSAAGEAARAGFNWALADLAARVSDAEEALFIRERLARQDWAAVRLPASLRPLAVLYGLARRKRGDGPLLDGIADGLAAVRLGLFGR